MTDRLRASSCTYARAGGPSKRAVTTAIVMTTRTLVVSAP
jgi:hypothetical protein